jgi:SAM-dependent methyltransferase
VKRSAWQKTKDFIWFPLRAVAVFEEDRFGLSSLRTDRFDFCAAEVRGRCLDVGCGRNNLFVTSYLDGNGKGIDFFAYEGLSKENLVEDPRHFPFGAASFETVTFIACLNHAPQPLRDAELAESFRCLKPSGNILVTMGEPFAEILVHQVVRLYDRIFHAKHDMDGERGMQEGEAYYLTDREIRSLLGRAGFQNIARKRFWTEWGLNSLYIGWKL